MSPTEVAYSKLPVSSLLEKDSPDPHITGISDGSYFCCVGGHALSTDNMAQKLWLPHQQVTLEFIVIYTEYKYRGNEMPERLQKDYSITWGKRGEKKNNNPQTMLLEEYSVGTGKKHLST